MALKNKHSSFVSTLLSAASILLQIHLLLTVAASTDQDLPILAPALYVFGDSIFECGNNNFLETPAKGNYTPYGIDFPSGKPTGRFTNGRTIADFIATSLGLPFAPPYMSLSEDEKSKITTGVSYASAESGILSETGSTSGHILSMVEQVTYFQEMVKKYLPKSFKKQEELSKYLAKSIIVVNIGGNDYLENYLQPEDFNSSKIYTPHQFADHLLDTLKHHFKAIYNLGGRKFVIFNIGPLGCTPAIVSFADPKPITPCVDSVNNLIKIYNEGVPDMIKELSSSLPGSNFVRGEVYKTEYMMIQDPSKYGFTAGRKPCCVLGDDGSCTPTLVPPCEDRTTHLYYDGYHPVERVYQKIAHGCFSGASLCFPINIKQLSEHRSVELLEAWRPTVEVVDSSPTKNLLFFN